MADASPLVRLTPYAETHEGRTLYFLTITSAANHARLDHIKADNAKLADPRLLTDPQEAHRIIENRPGAAWLAYSLHLAYLRPHGLMGDLVQGSDTRKTVREIKGSIRAPNKMSLHSSGSFC